MLLRSSIGPIMSLSQNSTGSNKKRSHVPCSNVISKRIKERYDEKVAQKKNWMKPKPTSTQKLFLSHSLDGGMGGGRGSDGKGRNLHEEDNNGRDKTNAYYQSMIEANPEDALLLGNYAKFLKEVCGDYAKAKEYLERAILANPGDGHNLSLYADLVWQTEKNVDRTERYFDQAIMSAPDDCYVLASYAKFLWDAEEEEEDLECQNKSDLSHAPLTDRVQEINNDVRLTPVSHPGQYEDIIVGRSINHL